MATSFTAPRVGIQDVKAEIDSLTEDEQLELYRDLYGQVKHKPEDPKEIQRQLEELDEALKQVPNDRKEHFLRAQELCPEIANHDSFRLQFIRADYYKVPDAAKRILNYWKAKEEIFGRERAYKKLVLSDFEDDDFSVPRNKGLYLLPQRDKAGRCILVSVKRNWIYPNRKNCIRWFWYLIETALEDENVQKLGAIVIGCDDGPFSLTQFDRKLEAKFHHVGQYCLPIRGAAIHHCFDSKVYEFVMPFILFLFTKNIRARYHIYPRSKAHMRLDQFEKMGISREIVPRLIGGENDFDVMEWIEERKKAGK